MMVMNRRTFDILVPIAYVIVVLAFVFVGNDTWLGGVAAIGAVAVGAYYAAIRQNIKA
jgi:hypothetical protein